MNVDLAKEFLLWCDEHHAETITDMYEDFKKQRKKRTYFLFWTFVANYADHPVKVRAESIKEAIQKGYPYDPEATNEFGRKVRLIVFEENGTLVHNGPIENIGKDPAYIEQETAMLVGYDWKKKEQREDAS